MPDRSQKPDDAAGSNDDESDGDDGYEIERFVTREDGAAVLRRLANGVENGSVELGKEGVVVALPDRFELEIEYERDEEKAELEAELEWPVVDGEPIAAERTSDAHERDDTEETEMGAVDAESNAAGEDEITADEGQPGVEADADTPIDEVVGSGTPASDARFELYRDRADEWRWRLVHRNGNIIADSGEGYDRKAAARNGLESVMRNAPGASVVVQDD